MKIVNLAMAAVLSLFFGATVAGSAEAPAPAKTAVYKEFVQGSPKAKVTVIEYASVTCPHCARFHTDSYPLLKRDYIDAGKIRFIFRDLPTPPAPLALAAAAVARCAPGDRGMPLLAKLFEHQSEWMKSPNESIRTYAQDSGMSSADVDACLQNEALLKEMMAVAENAGKLYQVHSTPTFIVGEERIDGEGYEPLRAAIDAALTKSK